MIPRWSSRRRRRTSSFPASVSIPEPSRLYPLTCHVLAHLLMPFFLALMHQVIVRILDTGEPSQTSTPASYPRSYDDPKTPAFPPSALPRPCAHTRPRRPEFCIRNATPAKQRRRLAISPVSALRFVRFCFIRFGLCHVIVRGRVGQRSSVSAHESWRTSTRVRTPARARGFLFLFR